MGVRLKVSSVAQRTHRLWVTWTGFQTEQHGDFMLWMRSVQRSFSRKRNHESRERPKKLVIKPD